VDNYRITDAGWAVVNNRRVHNQRNPIVITDERIAAVVAVVRSGVHVSTALRSCGLVATNVGRYREYQRKAHELGVDLATWPNPESCKPAAMTVGGWQGFKLIEQMDLAEAQSEVQMVTLMIDKVAHSKDAKAAMMLTGRRHPARWREVTSVEQLPPDSDVVRDEHMPPLLDPASQELLHEALEQIQRQQLEAGDTPPDADVVQQ